jgi:glycogen debranching enzyme
VSGVNTRRYHALLTASLNPPVERCVLLSRVEEEVDVDGTNFALSACQYPGVVAPKGYENLVSFEHQPCATWQYALGGAIVTKQVYLVPGRQAVVLRYRSDQAATLRIRPFFAYRDYHSLSHARHDAFAGQPPMEFRCDGQFHADPHWYNNIEYLAELDRGLDFREDLFTAGVWTLTLEPDQWATICASIDGSDACDPPVTKADPFIVRRADGRPTIIAGYPWLADWGRDTMIALPGLLISSGRLREAREIIECFLGHLREGLIPNRFPDSGEAPEYNTADATLWMFQAMRHWLAAGGDRQFLHDVFYPAAKKIITWHMRGTANRIAVDLTDGLLRAGGPGSQLTWMDAKVGDWVVTPRHGKPVEINALWHGALCSMAEWGDEVQFKTAAARVRASFREKFWNPTKRCLFDVLTPEGPVAKIRPNQVFAVSLPYDLLDREQQQSVMRVVSETLLTPMGLRTLDPADPDYRPRYEGGPWERDGAYHQGTVWPWLIGPYIDAYLTAFGQTPQTIEYCRSLVRGLEEESMRRGCLGSIAEIYDADEPRFPRGCPAQAWSVAEIARVKAVLLPSTEPRP